MGKNKQPVWQKIQGMLNRKTCAKMIYLISMTVVSVGILMTSLLSVTILVPYLKCANYVRTTCTTLSAEYFPLGSGTAKSNSWPECVNEKWRYPCARIFVSHITGPDINPIVALVHENEYNLIDSQREPHLRNCSFTRCILGTKENWRQIEGQMLKHGGRGQQYPCLFDPNNPYNVILGFYHDRRNALMSVLIPAGFALLFILLTCMSLLCVGCDVWGKQSYATASWERRISVLELEHAKQVAAAADVENNFLYGNKSGGATAGKNSWQYNNLNHAGGFNPRGLSSAEQCHQ